MLTVTEVKLNGKVIEGCDTVLTSHVLTTLFPKPLQCDEGDVLEYTIRAVDDEITVKGKA